jgi:methyltransferase (TIGR00027 family)
MKDGQPSLTAQGAAGHRAAHQLLEGGAIFRDPFARAILGDEACAEADARAADPASRGLRLFIAARSRMAEEALAAAVARGVRQAVVLGAGFDTFALRNPFADAGLVVFEVDHPATQAWKRARLAEGGLAVPASMRFAPIDFERENLAEALEACGFDADAPAFFLWLGVVPYLRREAVFATLRVVAQIPGAEVAFDYTEPLDNYPPPRRAVAVALAERVAAAGEPLICAFDPAEIAKNLRDMGFAEIEDMDFAAIAARFFSAPQTEGLTSGGPHVMRARRPR